LPAHRKAGVAGIGQFTAFKSSRTCDDEPEISITDPMGAFASGSRGVLDATSSLSECMLNAVPRYISIKEKPT
jgi:hypothetical protein